MSNYKGVRDGVSCLVVLNGGVFRRFPYFILGHRGTGETKLVQGPLDQEDAMWFVISSGDATDASALAKVALVAREIGRVKPQESEG
jgi:hypothetical protein